MSDRLFTTDLTVRFEGCSDENTARERLKHLRLSLNEMYSGAVQLTAHEDGAFGKENISFPAALGIRTDRYDYTTHGGDSMSKPRDSPEAWKLVVDVVNGVNILVDGVTMIYRSDFLNIADLSSIDIKQSEKFDAHYVNEHVTIYGETLASQFEEFPEWVKERAGTNYYIGSVEYDTRDFGGTDPSKSVEAVATDMIEQALTDLLPDGIANRPPSDGLLVNMRVPDSLTRAMDDHLAWQRSIDKSSKGAFGPPGVWVQVTWTNGLGFRPIEDVDYAYADIDTDE